jgi:hypothetical protein
MRPNVPPSEIVVMLALKNLYPQFLRGTTDPSDLQKFIRKRLDPTRGRQFLLAA